MTLYRMELYRILHRKILWILFGALLLWLGIFFCLEAIAGEHSKVDGSDYHGYEAIKIDRKISAEYEGILTDEDARRIIERYGFPSEVKENYGGWQDQNYLNGFVTEYLSDGYFSSWDDYRVAQNVVPLQDSSAAPYMIDSGKGVNFGYAKGWEEFLEMSQMAGWFLSVWLIIALAPVFCEERQNRMRPLIFTTEKGVEGDIKARIGASFTVAFLSYLFLIMLLGLLCKTVFGFRGGTMQTGLLLHMRDFLSFSHLEIRSFARLHILTGLCAILMLTGMIIWVSSKAGTTVHSMVISTLIWVLPVVLLMTFSGRILYFLAVLQPVFLTNYTCLAETGGMYFVRITVAVVTAWAGVICGNRIWGKMDLE